jgi:alpha-mannosidase
LTLEKDEGDTYSADPRPFEPAPTARIISIQLLEAREEYARVRLQRQIAQGDILIQTDEEIFLNQTPVLEWKVSADSRGANYRLRFTYRTNDPRSSVFAKMPYQVYQRPREDSNYFGQDTPQALRPVLLAARETDAVTDFPFQGFVALSAGSKTKAVFAKGLCEYQVDEAGTISITLKRSVEWLAKTNLSTRVGDAGPTMYVPGARDERRTQFELALVELNTSVRSPEFLKWYYLFEYGYLLFDNQTLQGTRSAVSIGKPPLPWSGIQTLEDGTSIMRIYNPYEHPCAFSEPYVGTDPFGETRRELSHVAPNQVEHLVYTPFPDAGHDTPPSRTDVQLIDFPAWPVGEDCSRIDEDRLDALRKTVKALKAEQAEAKERLAQMAPDGDELLYHRTQHTVIRLEREILEAEISVWLNELKRQENKQEIQEKIRATGRQLNLARRHRRTYDYILSLFEHRT